MTGRPTHAYWHELKFMQTKTTNNNKKGATCKICKKVVANTSIARLKQHRNVCVDQQNDVSFEFIDEFGNDYVPNNNKPTVESSTPAADGVIEVDENIPGKSSNDCSFKYKPRTPLNQSIDFQRALDGKVGFVDKMSSTQHDKLNRSLGKFFFGCNIPFSVVESDNFRQFLNYLRPSYKPPTRKTLASTILDEVYEQSLLNSTIIGKQSVMLIDGWKNTANNSKNVVTMLQTTEGQSAFLEAFDFSTESETGDALTNVVVQSIALAKEVYDSTVYAVVSDNAAAMLKMGRQVEIWSFACSSHTGNLLAKDMVDKDTAKKISDIVKEFKHPDLERKLKNLNGTKLITVAETRWCSHRDSFVSFRKNLQHLKTISAEGDSKVKENIVMLLYCEDMVKSCDEQIEALDPVCQLVNDLQKSTASIADAVEMWIKIEDGFPPSFISRLRIRQKMVLNTESLVANFLHPKYMGLKLSSEQLEIVEEYLIEEFDNNGLVEYTAYKDKTGRFGVLFAKDIKSSKTFWSLAQSKYPQLSCLAIKLLAIPASSAEIERLFSGWSFVHNKNRNRLTFDRSKKLLAIYHELKLKDSNKSDEY